MYNVRYCVIKVSRLWDNGEELPPTKPVREAGGRGEGVYVPSVTFKIVVLHIEEEAILLLGFYYFICAVAVVTYLWVIWLIFCCPVSLFQGYVACWN